MTEKTVEQAFQLAQQLDPAASFENFRRDWAAMGRAKRRELFAVLQAATANDDEFDLNSAFDAVANGQVDEDLLERIRALRNSPAAVPKS